MLLALLPSTLYLDHWAEQLTSTFFGSGVEEAEELSHHAHCHLTPGACSDQPVAPSVSVFPAVVEVSEPELPSVLLEDGSTALEEAVVAIPTEPPRI